MRPTTSASLHPLSPLHPKSSVLGGSVLESWFSRLCSEQLVRRGMLPHNLPRFMGRMCATTTISFPFLIPLCLLLDLVFELHLPSACYGASRRLGAEAQSSRTWCEGFLWKRLRLRRQGSRRLASRLEPSRNSPRAVSSEQHAWFRVLFPAHGSRTVQLQLSRHRRPLAQPQRPSPNPSQAKPTRPTRTHSPPLLRPCARRGRGMR
mmetsp:Transcript_11545/g.35685  ORF Transcript_11545/g.35685 Transcript_11545/m.35685 type:complete len:206 (-) Transcript_11545:14-631(-)